MTDLPIAAIIGAGVTGGRIARMLNASGTARIAVADHRRELAVTVAQFTDGAVIDAEYAEVADIAVLTHPAPHLELARRLIDSGVHVVSLSDDLDDVRSLLHLRDIAESRGVSLVIGAAMCPGLSGLLARLLSVRMHSVEEIHVAMHGTGGPACARQHHRSLAGTSLGWHDGEWITKPSGTGRELCWFPEPVNSYDCYRAEMPDPLLLHELFPQADRISARMSANRRDRFTARLPMLSPPHKEGGIGAVRVELRGALANGQRETLIVGAALRSGMAAAIVGGTIAKWVLAGRVFPGLVMLGDQRLDTPRLVADLADAGIVFHEFTGTIRPESQDDGDVPTESLTA